MKLCWENLDNLYLTKNGNLRKRGGCGSNLYVYKDSCKRCGKPFLAIETRAKGKVITNEFCSYSCCRKDRYCSPETRKKLSYLRKGTRLSDETKKKLSDLRKGKGLSDETKKKLSASLKGKMAGENNPAYKGGVTDLNIPLYDTYGPESSIFEEVRIHMLLIDCVVYKSLQIRCHNSICRRWFTPKRTVVGDRLSVFRGHVLGAHDFYCSGECKAECPTYNRRKYRRDENPNRKEKPYTKEQYKLYRKTVLERENYACEYCGAKATEVHHERSQKTGPMFVVDPDYGHAVCKACHIKYGHKTGTDCSTGNLAKKKC